MLKETELLDDNAIFYINSLSDEDRAEMAEANAMREAMEAEMEKNNLDVNGKKKGGGGILQNPKTPKSQITFCVSSVSSTSRVESQSGKRTCRDEGIIRKVKSLARSRYS